MKNTSSKVVTSLVALGIMVGSLPARADKAAVKIAEKQFEEFIAQQGKDNAQYPIRLANLCSMYARNGMIKEADETFNKAVVAQKATANPKNNPLPNMFSTYALALLTASAEKSYSDSLRRELKAKAQQVLHDGQPYANKYPAASLERLYYGLRAIQGYRMAGMEAEERETTAAYDRELKLLESDINLKREEYLSLAMMLLRMAQLYAPSPAFRVARMMQPIQVVPDDSPTKPGTIKHKDFKLAEDYHLRALNAYDRLPPADPTRIDAHRNMVFWYHLYGDTKKEEFATKILSDLMHTTDRNTLFPPAPPCPACGMG
jgi:hypothetical protein